MTESSAERGGALPRVVVCGVGALGSHTVMFCRNLPARLVLVDCDRVERRNLRSQAFTRQAVGRNKAEAMRLQLYTFHGLAADAHAVRLTEQSVAAATAGAALLVDCLDNAAGRRVLSEHAQRTGTPLVHAGLSGDGTFGLVRWEERFAADEEDTAGQATCTDGRSLPLIGLVAGALAQIIQEDLAGGTRRDVMVTPTGVQTTTVV